MKTYDLRSDTITRPSLGMRKAMMRADVGDDVYGEDPTVNKLQEMAAALTGKKDALFVSSGSMGNLISIFLHAGSGKEVLTHKDSHIIHHELSSASALAGSALIGLDGERGKLSPETIEKALRPDIYYMPKSGMIEIENTIGGVYYRGDELKAIFEFARKKGLPVHMDGARLFNASEASGMSIKKIASYANSVTFCLSKGLGAPVGSLLCGSSKFIKHARRIRKMLGGGTRQAGIIAAAGIYALEHNVERLKDDRENAMKIAETLSSCSWARIDPAEVETNILFFGTKGRDPEGIVDQLKRKGILCGADGKNTIRMVTSLAVPSEDIEDVCKILKDFKPVKSR
ncbi:MAG: low specificity L-threonine aldolase [Spirochaetales bacterium]|nr:low specificity L-threonine aldolase [Spirochaetales bacterium]